MSSKIILVVLLALLATASSFEDSDEDGQNLKTEKTDGHLAKLLKEFLAPLVENLNQHQNETKIKTEASQRMEIIIKNRILVIKNEDILLAKLLSKLYTSSLSVEAVATDIVEYVKTADKGTTNSPPLDLGLIKEIKNFRRKILYY